MIESFSAIKLYSALSLAYAICAWIFEFCLAVYPPRVLCAEEFLALILLFSLERKPGPAHPRANDRLASMDEFSIATKPPFLMRET